MLAEVLAQAEGVLRRRDHPELRHAIDTAFRRSELVRLLPGTYATPAVAATLKGRARAVCLFDPDAVIAGDAAAWLSGWDLRQPTTVLVYSPHRRRPAEGYEFRRRALPRHLVRRMKGYRVTARALTALDAPPSVKDPVEFVLRKGASLEDLERALASTSGRRGNVERRRLLADARDSPWSPAERKAHAALRRGRIRGWRANAPLHDSHGEVLGYGDLVFEGIRLVIELDGPTHDGREGQVKDSGRDLALERAGWEVIRFGVGIVDDSARFTAIVRDIVRSRAHRVRGPVEK